MRVFIFCVLLSSFLINGVCVNLGFDRFDSQSPHQPPPFKSYCDIFYWIASCRAKFRSYEWYPIVFPDNTKYSDRSDRLISGSSGSSENEMGNYFVNVKKNPNEHRGARGEILNDDDVAVEDITQKTVPIFSRVQKFPADLSKIFNIKKGSNEGIKLNNIPDIPFSNGGTNDANDNKFANEIDNSVGEEYIKENLEDALQAGDNTVSSWNEANLNIPNSNDANVDNIFDETLESEGDHENISNLWNFVDINGESTLSDAMEIISDEEDASEPADDLIAMETKAVDNISTKVQSEGVPKNSTTQSYSHLDGGNGSVKVKQISQENYDTLSSGGFSLVQNNLNKTQNGSASGVALASDTDFRRISTHVNITHNSVPATKSKDLGIMNKTPESPAQDPGNNSNLLGGLNKKNDVRSQPPILIQSEEIGRIGPQTQNDLIKPLRQISNFSLGKSRQIKNIILAPEIGSYRLETTSEPMKNIESVESSPDKLSKYTVMMPEFKENVSQTLNIGRSSQDTKGIEDISPHQLEANKEQLGKNDYIAVSLAELVELVANPSKIIELKSQIKLRKAANTFSSNMSVTELLLRATNPPLDPSSVSSNEKNPKESKTKIEATESDDSFKGTSEPAPVDFEDLKALLNSYSLVPANANPTSAESNSKPSGTASKAAAANLLEEFSYSMTPHDINRSHNLFEPPDILDGTHENTSSPAHTDHQSESPPKNMKSNTAHPEAEELFSTSNPSELKEDFITEKSTKMNVTSLTTKDTDYSHDSNPLFPTIGSGSVDNLNSSSVANDTRAGSAEDLKIELLSLDAHSIVSNSTLETETAFTDSYESQARTTSFNTTPPADIEEELELATPHVFNSTERNAVSEMLPENPSTDINWSTNSFGKTSDSIAANPHVDPEPTIIEVTVQLTLRNSSDENPSLKEEDEISDSVPSLSLPTEKRLNYSKAQIVNTNETTSSHEKPNDFLSTTSKSGHAVDQSPISNEGDPVLLMYMEPLKTSSSKKRVLQTTEYYRIEEPLPDEEQTLRPNDEKKINSEASEENISTSENSNLAGELGKKVNEVNANVSVEQLDKDSEGRKSEKDQIEQNLLLDEEIATGLVNPAEIETVTGEPNLMKGDAKNAATSEDQSSEKDPVTIASDVSRTTINELIFGTSPRVGPIDPIDKVDEAMHQKDSQSLPNEQPEDDGEPRTQTNEPNYLEDPNSNKALSKNTFLYDPINISEEDQIENESGTSLPKDQMDGTSLEPMHIGEFITKANSVKASLPELKLDTDEEGVNTQKDNSYRDNIPFNLLNENEEQVDLFNSNIGKDDEESQPNENEGRSDIPIEEEDY